MVEAGRIELPSALESLKLLRAYPIFESRYDNCRSSGHHRNQRPRLFSSCDPVTQSQDYPAVVASLRLAGVGGETSWHLSRESVLFVRFYVFFRIFYEANRSPRRATGASTNTSKPIAPMTSNSICSHAMKQQLLIFDLDGTLVDSRADLATSVNLLRAHYSLPPLPLETVTNYIGNGVRVLVTRALDGTGINIDQALAIQRPLYATHLVDQTSLYPGVRAGLERLKTAGHILAVATNKPIEASTRILNHLGVAPFFFSVLGGGSVPNLKPHPEMVEVLMKETNSTPQNTWIIGDNYTDLECARHAGASSVFVTYGYGFPGAETPLHKVDSFPAILPLFGLK